MKKTVSLILAAVFAAYCLSGCAIIPQKVEMATFSSDNGYSIDYPAHYSPTSLKNTIDFVITDEKSGSGVTIMATPKQEGLLDVPAEDYIAAIKSNAKYDVELVSYNKETINQTPALIICYTYGSATVTQALYDASDNSYCVTFTKMPGIDDATAAELEALLRALRV